MTGSHRFLVFARLVSGPYLFYCLKASQLGFLVRRLSVGATWLARQSTASIQRLVTASTPHMSDFCHSSLFESSDTAFHLRGSPLSHDEEVQLRCGAKMRESARLAKEACFKEDPRVSAGQIRAQSMYAAAIRPAGGSCQVAADSVGYFDCHRSSDPPDVGERWASSKVEWPPMSSLLERFFAPHSPSRSSRVPLLQRLLRCPV